MDDGSEDYSKGIPDTVIETLARCLFPKMVAFFESPEGQAEFEQWKRQKNNTA